MNNETRNIIYITPKDNVAVAVKPIAKGSVIDVGNGAVTVIDDIPQGHKIAISAIARGENIIKYGTSIGHATEDISAGVWVHTHNMKTNLSGEIQYTYSPEKNNLQHINPVVFNGYLRKDGRVGIRNEIWIIPTVGCVNDVANKLVRDNQDLVNDNIDGLYAFTHPFGCSQTGADHAQTRKLLAALAHHPNAGAVLILSLGCENLTHEQFVKELGVYDPDRIMFLTCQEVKDEFAEGRKILQKLASFAGSFKRQPISADKLVIGMKCGGSDGLSGLTANPVVGRFSDLLVAMGGTTVLTEVPEMFGAEDMLLGDYSGRSAHALKRVQRMGIAV